MVLVSVVTGEEETALFGDPRKPSGSDPKLERWCGRLTPPCTRTGLRAESGVDFCGCTSIVVGWAKASFRATTSTRASRYQPSWLGSESEPGVKGKREGREGGKAMGLGVR